MNGNKNERYAINISLHIFLRMITMRYIGIEINLHIEMSQTTNHKSEYLIKQKRINVNRNLSELHTKRKHPNNVNEHKSLMKLRSRQRCGYSCDTLSYCRNPGTISVKFERTKSSCKYISSVTKKLHY